MPATAAYDGGDLEPGSQAVLKDDAAGLFAAWAAG